jgi:hypothetical protein
MASDPLISPSLKEPSTNDQFSFWHTLKPYIPQILVTLLVDIVLPLVIYLGLQNFIKPVYALLIAGIPPFLMVIYKAIFFRRFDALGFLVFLAFLISAIFAIVTENAIILLLEKSLVTGIYSLILAITLIPLHSCHPRCRLRPFVYYFYEELIPTSRAEVGLPESVFNDSQEQTHHQYIQLSEKLSPSKSSNKQEVAEVYNWIYTNCSSFRVSCYIITGVWSVGLFSELLARLTLILFDLSVNSIVIYGDLILTVITIICVLISVICLGKERKETMIFIEQWKKEHLKV